MSIYYKIWVDAIVKIKSNPLRKEDWKWIIQSLMASAMGVKLMFFMAIINRHLLNIPFSDVGFNFPILDSFVKGMLFFFIPPFLINYLLIFRNNKYEILLNKYKNHNGKLFITYFFVSIFVPLIILIIAFLLK